MNQCTEQSFLHSVRKHQLEVIKEDGVYRHLRFSKPGTIDMQFDLITWPGYLCYCGDMGTYVFQRLHDMLEFFRSEREPVNGKTLYINQGYWSEKLQAVDGNRRSASAMEFSNELFIAVINETRVGWMKERTLNKDQRRELWECVQDEIIDRLEDPDESHAIRLANEFRSVIDGEKHQFDDIWEHNFHDYTTQFTWCCYALAWGIQRYDEIKGTTNE